MQSIHGRLSCAFLLAVIACQLIQTSRCQAQWVPPAGQGSISLEYEYSKINDHLFSVDLDGYVDPGTGYAGGPGNHMYLGDVVGQTVNLSATYGAWRGLAITASGAYVTSKYSGKAAESPLDDGLFHGSLQDAGVTAQYMFLWRGFAITPTVGAQFPIIGYSNLGHASIGKDLHEYPLGISVGRALDPLLPRAFLSGNFTYSFLDSQLGHNIDQRHYNAAVGYIFSNAFSVGGTFEYLDTVGGIDWALDDLTMPEVYDNHDVAAKARYSRVGGHVGYSMAKNFGITLSYVGTVWGENTHAGQSISIIPTWNFGGPRGQ